MNLKKAAFLILTAPILIAAADVNLVQIEALDIPSKLEGLTLVEFYQPKCPHCQELAPVMTKVLDYVNSSESLKRVQIRQCSCKKTRPCRDLGLKIVPTLRLYRDQTQISELPTDVRDFEGIVSWLAASITEEKPQVMSKGGNVTPNKVTKTPSVLPKNVIIH